tara:strand:- start:63 stop:932 length:870 start_codon:yes stop_codon:yes gene_type:complete
MYFDEDIVLDLRLNSLNDFVDHFVIVESTFNHKGEKRDLKFNINKYKDFKKKIIYLVFDKEPEDLEIFNKNDSENIRNGKYILNAGKRENAQRNFISSGIREAKDNDIILISDVDEIPNLKKTDFLKIKEKIIMFQQDMFYYKFNLKLPKYIWVGTKGCRKKDFISPQWLRNVKDKKYSFYRIDTLFSKTKYASIRFINDGGWHFTNIKSAKEIEHKLKSYLHHLEFDINPLTVEEIEKIMNENYAIYNLNVDQRKTKFGKGPKLYKIEFDKLPQYIRENNEKFERWLD